MKLETPVSEATLRDRLLRVLQRQPWLDLDEITDRVPATRDDVEQLLEQLVDEDLVDHYDDRFAIDGTRRPAKLDYPQRELGDSADELERIVRENPWRRASFYAAEKDVHRNAAYEQLDNLTERDRLQMTVHDGVKHWGPPDQDPPDGHMQMAPDAGSPVRQALAPRILSLLTVEPWTTVSTIAERLEANRKSVDTRIRNLHDQDELRREAIPYQGKRTVYAYALADSRDLTDDDRHRVREAQLERLPDHYGQTQDRVLSYLQRDNGAWSTARQITRGLKNMTMSRVQSALSTLLDKGTIVRVADGEYRYALQGTQLDRDVSGHLRHGGKRSQPLEVAIDLLEQHGELSTPELVDQVQDDLDRDCPGLPNQLHKAEDRGTLGSRHARRGEGAQRHKVTIWGLRDGADRSPGQLLGMIEARAAELRDQGWTVDVDATPPTDQEDPG